MVAIFEGQSVSAVISYGVPQSVDDNPMMSPGLAMRRLNRLPSLELIDRRTLPSRITKIALPFSPSENSTTLAAKDDGYSMSKKPSSAEEVNLRKNSPARLVWLMQPPSRIDSINGLRLGRVCFGVTDFLCEILRQRTAGKNLCAGLRNDLSQHLLAVFIRVSQIAQI